MSGQSFSIQQADVVVASVQAPAQYLSHTVFQYQIDGSSLTFAAATKSKFNNSLNQEDSHKRWWDYYLADPHLISFRTGIGDLQSSRTLGYNITNELPINTYSVCDQQTRKVYFFTETGLLIESLEFSSAPVQCEAFNQFYLVSCEDGSLYKVTLDKQGLSNTLARQPTPAINRDWIFELCFETDIPLQGTVLKINQQKVLANSAPGAKCISPTSQQVWIGGYKHVWLLDAQLQVIAEVELPDLVTGIQQLNGKAVAVTRSGLIYVLTAVGNTIEKQNVFSGGWLSNPCSVGNAVYVSNSEAGKILKFDSTTFNREEISIDNFSPSYLSTDGSNLYICGHDTSVIKVYDGSNFTEIGFLDRVTFAQPKFGNLLVSHKLKSINVLDHSLMTEALINQPPKVRTTLTVAGAAPQKLELISGSDVTIQASPGITTWVNGRPSSNAANGDYISVSKEFDQVGLYSYYAVIGDSVLDFIFDVVDEPLVENRDLQVLPRQASQSVQYDFILPANVETVSVDYGKILKNFAIPDSLSWKKGDVVSIIIDGALAGVVSTLSIGKQHFYLPIVPADIHTELQKGIGCGSNAVYTYTVEQAGDYFFPYTFDKLVEKEKSFLGNTFTSLGGPISPLYPIENLYLNDKDVYSNYTYVDVTQGQFDVYVDLVTPQILTAFLISPRFGQVEIPNTRPPQYTTATKDAPITFNIQASNDTVTWEILGQFSPIESQWLLDINSATEFSFNNTNSYRYWRLQVTQDNGMAVSLTAWTCKGLSKESSLKINSIVAAPGVHTLTVGTNVEFNVGTSQFLFDERTLAITGPKSIIFTARTQSKPFLAEPIFLGHISDLVSRTTLETELTLQGLFQPVKFCSDESQKIYVNGSIATVPTQANNGDDIKIEKLVNGIFEDRASVYIVQDSTVKVEFAYWTLSSQLPTSVGFYTDPVMMIDSFTTSAIQHKDLIGVGSTFAKPKSFGSYLTTKFNFGKLHPQTLAQFQKYNFEFTSFPFSSTQKFETTYAPSSFSTVDKLEWIFAEDRYYDALSIQFNRPDRQEYLVQHLDFNNPTLMAGKAVNTFNFNINHEDPIFSTDIGFQEIVLISEQVILRPIQQFDAFKMETAYWNSSTFANGKMAINDQKYSVSYDTQIHPAYLEHKTESFENRRGEFSYKNSEKFNVERIADNPNIVLDFNFLIDQVDVITGELPYLFGPTPLHIKQGNQVIRNLEPTRVKQGNQVIRNLEPTRINTGFNVNLDSITDWLNDIDGSFITAEAASHAATQKGHLPFVVLYIPDTNLYTYRRLSVTSKICAPLPPGAIVAISGLIQGG